MSLFSKFVISLSDQDFNELQEQVSQERIRRHNIMCERHEQYKGNYPELTESEKAIAITSKLDAIKAYRIRTGVFLKESLNQVEEFLRNKNG